jgi:hypothetical protein
VIVTTGAVTADNSGDPEMLAPGSQSVCLKVTILLFSGRPNPVYFICDELTIDNIRSNLAFSQTNHLRADSPVIPSRLGYQGIIVQNINDAPGIPQRMAMNTGDIEIGDMQQTEYLLDDGALEDALIDEAFLRGVIDRALLDYIERQR